MRTALRFARLMAVLAAVGPSAHASIDSLWSSPSTAGAKGYLTAPGSSRADYYFLIDSVHNDCRIYNPDNFSQLYDFYIGQADAYTYLWSQYIPDADANGHPEAIIYAYDQYTYRYSLKIVDMSSNSTLASWTSGSYSFFPKFLAATPGSNVLKLGIEKSSSLLAPHPSILMVYSLGVAAAVAGPGPGAARAPGIALEQSVPNPSSDHAVIEFSLPAAGRTVLTVYNQIGQAVRTLVDGPLGPGKHRIPFDGRGLPNGAYFYRLTTPDGAEVRKLLLVR